MSKLFVSREIRLRGNLESPDREVLYRLARKLERNFEDWLFLRDGLGIGIFLTVGFRLGSGTINLTNFRNDDEKREAPQNQTTVTQYIELINNLLWTSIHPCFEPMEKLTVCGTVMIELPDKRSFRLKFDNRTDTTLVYNLELRLPPQKLVQFIPGRNPEFVQTESDPDSDYGSV